MAESFDWLPRDLKYWITRCCFDGSIQADVANAIVAQGGKKTKVTAETIAQLANLELQRRGIAQSLTAPAIRKLILSTPDEFIVFRPPEIDTCVDALADRMEWKHEERWEGRIRVVDVQPLAAVFKDDQAWVGETIALEDIARTAGDLVYELIHRRAYDKADSLDEANASIEVHVAYGSGRTSHAVVKRLAKQFRHGYQPRQFSKRPPLPELNLKIVFHALSADFSPDSPEHSPAAGFGLLKEACWSDFAFEFVGISAEPVHPTDLKADFRQLSGVKRAMEEKHKIDIAFSSLSTHERQSLWSGHIDTYGVRDKLIAANWQGDFQFNPYSDKPIVPETVGYQATTLFSLEEYQNLATSPDKHVVLIAGPGKLPGLLPLVNPRNKVLSTIWDHLVVDKVTALDILDADKSRMP